MKQPDESLRELVRQTNARTRSIFEGIAADPYYGNFKPLADKFYPVVIGLTEQVTRLVQLEDRCNEIVQENGSSFNGAPALEYGAGQSQQKEISADLNRTLNANIPVITDVYNSPLRDQFPHLIPVIWAYLTPVQRTALAQKCPHVAWPEIL